MKTKNQARGGQSPHEKRREAEKQVAVIALATGFCTISCSGSCSASLQVQWQRVPSQAESGSTYLKARRGFRYGMELWEPCGSHDVVYSSRPSLPVHKSRSW